MTYLFNCVTDGNERVQTTEGKMRVSGILNDNVYTK